MSNLTNTIQNLLIIVVFAPILSCIEYEKVTDLTFGEYKEEVIDHLCSQWSCVGWSSKQECTNSLEANERYGLADSDCFDSEALRDCQDWMSENSVPEDCSGLPGECAPGALTTDCDTGDPSIENPEKADLYAFPK